MLDVLVNKKTLPTTNILCGVAIISVIFNKKSTNGRTVFSISPLYNGLLKPFLNRFVGKLTNYFWVLIDEILSDLSLE